MGWNYDLPQSIGRVRRSTGISACWCGRWPTSWRTAATASARPPRRSAERQLHSQADRASLSDRLPGPACTSASSATCGRPSAGGHRLHRQAPDRLQFHPYTVSFPLIVHGADDRADRDRERVSSTCCERDDLDRQEIEENPEKPDLTESAPTQRRSARWMKHRVPPPATAR